MATNSTLFFKALISAGSNTDATSYAAASTAATQGQVVFCCHCSLKATAPDTPTLSGTNCFSGSWTQIGSTVTLQTPAGNFIGVSWFWALAQAGGAGVITANYTNTQLGSTWQVVQSPFVNTTTPTAQSGSNTDTTSSTANPSLTLGSALAASANWALFAMVQNTSGAPSRQATTAAYDPWGNIATTSTSDGIGMRLYVAPSITMTNPSSTWTASVAKIVFGIEVSQDGTGASSGGAAIITSGGGHSGH